MNTEFTNIDNNKDLKYTEIFIANYITIYRQIAHDDYFFSYIAHHWNYAYIKVYCIFMQILWDTQEIGRQNISIHSITQSVILLDLIHITFHLIHITFQNTNRYIMIYWHLHDSCKISVKQFLYPKFKDKIYVFDLNISFMLKIIKMWFSVLNCIFINFLCIVIGL